MYFMRSKVKAHFCNAITVCAHVKSVVSFPSRYLVHCLQADLNNYMPAFLDDPEEHNPQRPKIGGLNNPSALPWLLLAHLLLFNITSSCLLPPQFNGA